MCVLQTCVTLHQERCVRSSIKSGEYPEKAEFLPESRSKSGSNYAEAKYFGKSQVAGVINRGSHKSDPVSERPRAFHLSVSNAKPLFLICLYRNRFSVLG